MTDDQIISDRTSVAVGFAFLQLSLVLRGLRDGGATSRGLTSGWFWKGV